MITADTDRVVCRVREDVFNSGPVVSASRLQQGNDALSKYLVAFNPFELVDATGVILLGVNPGSEYDVPTTFVGGVIMVSIFVLLTLACLGLLFRRYRRIGAS